MIFIIILASWSTLTQEQTIKDDATSAHLKKTLKKKEERIKLLEEKLKRRDRTNLDNEDFIAKQQAAIKKKNRAIHNLRTNNRKLKGYEEKLLERQKTLQRLEDNERHRIQIIKRVRIEEEEKLKMKQEQKPNF